MDRTNQLGRMRIIRQLQYQSGMLQLRKMHNRSHRCTLTGFASILIFPHETASSGFAPESLLRCSDEATRAARP